MVELECEKPSLPPYAQTEAAARDAGGILYFGSVAVPLGKPKVDQCAVRDGGIVGRVAFGY